MNFCTPGPCQRWYIDPSKNARNTQCAWGRMKRFEIEGTLSPLASARDLMRWRDLIALPAIARIGGDYKGDIREPIPNGRFGFLACHQ